MQRTAPPGLGVAVTLPESVFARNCRSRLGASPRSSSEQRPHDSTLLMYPCDQNGAEKSQMPSSRCRLESIGEGHPRFLVRFHRASGLVFRIVGYCAFLVQSVQNIGNPILGRDWVSQADEKPTRRRGGRMNAPIIIIIIIIFHERTKRSCQCGCNHAKASTGMQRSRITNNGSAVLPLN
jgi:hypothetical protein